MPFRYPPVTLASPVDGLQVQYSCPNCGDDVDYEDGLSCEPCGLSWGNKPEEKASVSSEWESFVAELVRDQVLPADSPTHLLINPPPAKWEVVDGHARVLHVGCPTKVTCEHNRVMLDALGLFMRGQVEIATGVDYVTTFFMGRTVAKLPGGVYRVEATGMELAPLRVAELLALPPEGVEFGAYDLARHRPGAAVTLPERVRGMVTVNLPA